MYCGHVRLCVCLSDCVYVCLSAAVRPHYCTDPDVTCGRGRGYPLLVHYWAAVWTAGFHCWRSGNIMGTQNVSEYMLVLALCLVVLYVHIA